MLLVSSSLFFRFSFFAFFFTIVYIIKRDAFPSGPLIRVGRVRDGGKWIGQRFQLFLFHLFFLFVSAGVEVGTHHCSSALAPAHGIV